MNDAWNIPGFTVQNENWGDALNTSGDPAPTLPESVKTVTVTGTFLDDWGKPAAGRFVFDPSIDSLVDPVSGLTIRLRRKEVHLVNGQLSEPLIATDNDALSPKNFTYKVSGVVSGTVQRPFSVALPSAVPTVSLAALAEVPSSMGTISVPAIPGPKGDTGLSGPAGPKGDTGLTGPKGDTGPQGTPTTVNGKTGASIDLTASDVNADVAGAATAAVNAHLQATDPHGDRSYADSTFQPLLNGPLTGVYNVRSYGAKGDDTTDDYDAINAALAACPEGGTLFFPPGQYRVRAPLMFTRNRTYRGSHAPRWQYRGGSPCVIKPHPSFTGSKIIHIADKEITGASLDNDGGRIENLAILGQNAGSGVVGVLFEGLVRDWKVRDVDVSNTSGNGWQTLGFASSDSTTHYPRGLDLYSVTSYAAHNNAFSFASLTDSTVFDALAVSATSIGFLIDNPGEVKYIGCRSVFNQSDGFRVTGTVSVGGVQFVGCSTDRNQTYGVRVTASGSQPITFTDLLTRRDGKNSNLGGGGYSGIAVLGTSGATACPVVITGLSQVVGVDDGAASTGNDSPQYGVRVEYAKHVRVSGAAWGATNAVFDNGNNTSLDISGLYRQNGLAAARAVETTVVGAQPTVTAASGAGTSPPSPTLASSSDNISGVVNLGTGTSPTTGSQATVTFARTRARVPVVVAVPANTSTNARQVGVANVTASGFTLTFGVAGTASQPAGTYQVSYHVLDQANG
ncbi:pectate lyase-like protein [Streptomyces sp. BK022]|uniref:glycosyl hydrolase family 28-related protein n=1 Tax=Streptomyces sp. BK022 TaxID=2512123 RepID=UPI0010E0BC47|nr:glycosyl hydrolase family 28-related protein [Streptomyces sp. BK022]RZU35920.1 pectate lyase-like protein [Streptomyces sp. BK022]